MTFDGQITLSITATNPADMKDHFISVQASLSDYPSIQPVETVLIVTIEGCIIEALSVI